VAAAADGDFELLAAREAQRGRDVRRAGALDDQGRVLVMCGVPERAGVVVARVARTDDLAVQLGRELRDRCVTEDARFVRCCSHGLLPPVGVGAEVNSTGWASTVS
jgi:hypothetical protein